MLKLSLPTALGAFIGVALGILVLALIFIALGTPARAYMEHREQHHAWGLTCFPADGDAFNVTTNAEAGGILMIHGKHGVSRSNVIESTENTNNGFIVVANGDDFKGNHRELELHVSMNGHSFLAVNRDLDHLIACGDARGIDD